MCVVVQACGGRGRAEVPSIQETYVNTNFSSLDRQKHLIDNWWKNRNIKKDICHTMA